MSPRQRGAAWFLALVLLGRSLDFFPLPFLASPTTDPESMPASVLPGAGPERPESTTTAPPPAAPTPAAADTSVRIAINQAGVQELQRLPRVGPVLAARIVAARESGGPFRSAADLQRVRGIGPRTAARLAPLVRFE